VVVPTPRVSRAVFATAWAKAISSSDCERPEQALRYALLSHATSGDGTHLTGRVWFVSVVPVDEPWPPGCLPVKPPAVPEPGVRRSLLCPARVSEPMAPWSDGAGVEGVVVVSARVAGGLGAVPFTLGATVPFGLPVGWPRACPPARAKLRASGPRTQFEVARTLRLTIGSMRFPSFGERGPLTWRAGRGVGELCIPLQANEAAPRASRSTNMGDDRGPKRFAKQQLTADGARCTGCFDGC